MAHTEEQYNQFPLRDRVRYQLQCHASSGEKRTYVNGVATLIGRTDAAGEPVPGIVVYIPGPPGLAGADLSEEVEGLTGDLGVLNTALGQPVAGPVAGWVEVDIDEDGLFVRGRDTRDFDHRALAASIAPQEKAPTKIVNWSDWKEAQIDDDGFLVRGVGLDGVTYIARGGRIVPLTNALLLQSAVAYGDSTTWGDDLDGDLPVPAEHDAARWTGLLGTALGIHIENRGGNGQTAAQIAARMTGIIPRATVTGGSIPASGTVGLTGVSVDIFVVGGMTYSPRTVDLVADDGTRVRGRLDRTGSSAYTFVRYEAGAVVSTAGVDIYSVRGWEDCAKHVFVGMGINDEGGIGAGTTTLDQDKEWYRAATSVCRGGFTVWGLLDRGVSEAAGTTNGDYIRSMEAWFRVEYGANYCPVRVYLASQRALDDAVRLDAGFTPTTDDADAVTAGVVPPSFRYSVHLNTRGHQLMALCLERHLRFRFNI